ncbi:hypothetical protein PMAYCL1PPCAC_29284, partial [Pristionchus mayeri]
GEVEEWEEWDDWNEIIVPSSSLYHTISRDWLSDSCATTSFLSLLSSPVLEQPAYDACEEYGINRFELEKGLRDAGNNVFIFLAQVDEYWRKWGDKKKSLIGSLCEMYGGKDEYGCEEEIEKRDLWTRVLLYLEWKHIVPKGFGVLFLAVDSMDIVAKEIDGYLIAAIRLASLCYAKRLRSIDGELYEKETKMMREVKGLIRKMVRITYECATKYPAIFGRTDIKLKGSMNASSPISSLTFLDEVISDENWIEDCVYFALHRSSCKAVVFSRAVNLLSFVDHLIFNDDVIPLMLPIFPHLKNVLSYDHLENSSRSSSFNTLFLLSHIGVFPRGFLTLILHKEHSALYECLLPLTKIATDIHSFIRRLGERDSEEEREAIYSSIRSLTTRACAHLYSHLFGDLVLKDGGNRNEGEMSREMEKWIGEGTKWIFMKEDCEWRKWSEETDPLRQSGSWDMSVKRIQTISVKFLSRLNMILFENNLLESIVNFVPEYRGISIEQILNPLTLLAYRILMHSPPPNHLPKLIFFLALRKIEDDESSMDDVIALLKPIVPFIFPVLMGMQRDEMREMNEMAMMFTLGSLVPNALKYLKRWPQLLRITLAHYRRIQRGTDQEMTVGGVGNCEDKWESPLALLDGRIVSVSDYSLLMEGKSLFRHRSLPDLGHLLTKAMDVVMGIDDNLFNEDLLALLKSRLETVNVRIDEASLGERMSGHGMEIVSILDSVHLFPPGFFYLLLINDSEEIVDALSEKFGDAATREYIERAMECSIKCMNGDDEARREYERILEERLNALKRMGVGYREFFPCIDQDTEDRVKKSWIGVDLKNTKKNKIKRDSEEKREKRQKIGIIEISDSSVIMDNQKGCDYIDIKREVNEKQEGIIHYEKMVNNKSIVNRTPAIDPAFLVFAIGRNCEEQKKWEESRIGKIEELTIKMEENYALASQKAADVEKKMYVFTQLCLAMRPQLNGEKVGMFMSGSFYSSLASSPSNLDITFTSCADLSSEAIYAKVLPHLMHLCNNGSSFVSNTSNSVDITVNLAGSSPTNVTFHFTKRTNYFSSLITIYGKMDRRFGVLFLNLKKWARAAFREDEGVTSYVLASLIIHYLHCGLFPPILPCLPKLDPHQFIPDEWGKLNTAFVNSSTVQCNETSVGILLIRFFLYFSNFPFDKFIISIRRGGIIHKSSHKENLPLVCIEDPFDQSILLNRPIKSDIFIDRLREALKTLYITCRFV